MENIFLLVHISNILFNTAFIQIDLLMGITGISAGGFALIAEHNLHTTIEVGQFSQAR